MANAFGLAFSKGADRAVLIGSDFPDLEADIIHEAFAGLSSHDVVIGPAKDGGYYLIGFGAGSFCPKVFSDMPWGTRRVFSKTMDSITKQKFKAYVLPEWQDIDTPEDLKHFYQRSRQSGKRELKTLKFLCAHKGVIDF